MAAQAVGGAVGHNPISIIIPCHRVVGTNGNLTGYGGGLDVKIKLLELEGADMSRLFRPKKEPLCSRFTFSKAAAAPACFSTGSPFWASVRRPSGRQFPFRRRHR